MDRRRPSTATATDAAVQTAAPQAAAHRQLADAKDSPASVPRPKRGVPEGLWLKCDGCGATIYRKEAEERLNV